MTNWTHTEVCDTKRETIKVPMSYHGECLQNFVSVNLVLLCLSKKKLTELDYMFIGMEYTEALRATFGDEVKDLHSPTEGILL